MRTFPGTLLLSVALTAQVTAPPPPPPWLTALEKVQREMHEAPLRSLEIEVEQAWRAALAMPDHPEFRAAAQIAAHFYQSQGYDLEAEKVLRQAMAALPEAEAAEPRRILASQLAGHFESAGQSVAALAIREELARQSPPDHELGALANLWERMGEPGKAEALWKQMAERQAAIDRSASREPAPHAMAAAAPANRMAVTAVSRAFYPAGGRYQLAAFYTRQGRVAEAEQLYRKALAAAASESSLHELQAAEDGYIGFLTQQSRLGEAAALLRQSIARLERSADPHAARMLFPKRQQLASLLVQAGHPDEAFELQKQTAAEAEARSPDSPEYPQALAALAETLIQQNQLEEAEQVIAKMRQVRWDDARSTPFHESLALQMLARIRDMQKRPEEAQGLREQAGVPDVMGRGRNPAATVYDLVGPAQQAAHQGQPDSAVAIAGQAVALAEERVWRNPMEVAALTGLAQALHSARKEKEARRLAAEALRILDRAPDHPRVADALGSVVFTLNALGMRPEAERVLERQEKILIAAKGDSSPRLSSVSEARIALLQQDSNWTGVLEERKRALDRTQKAAGAKSRDSLHALRNLIWIYPLIDNWPEEERVLSVLVERTAAFAAESLHELPQLFQHIANRYSQQERLEEALNWMDRAIEAAQRLPHSVMLLPGMQQQRAGIARRKEAPPEASAPVAVPGGTGGPWFTTDRFQRTDGMRLGEAPPPAAKAPKQ